MICHSDKYITTYKKLVPGAHGEVWASTVDSIHILNIVPIALNLTEICL